MRNGSTDLVIARGRVARGVFPPEEVAQVKAIACGLPREHGLPLSRFSRAELHRLVVERGVCEASASTIARWLAEDALKPWQHRSWIFPTDPAFLEKAGPVLDLPWPTFCLRAALNALNSLNLSEECSVERATQRLRRPSTRALKRRRIQAPPAPGPRTAGRTRRLPHVAVAAGGDCAV